MAGNMLANKAPMQCRRDYRGSLQELDKEIFRFAGHVQGYTGGLLAWVQGSKQSGSGSLHPEWLAGPSWGPAARV